MINITEIRSFDIFTKIGKLTRTQTTGLNCLIFLALREQTTVAYQKKEWGFEDIPEQIIQACDSLEENDLIELATDIATGLLEELVGAAGGTETAQNLCFQPVKKRSPIYQDCDR